MGYDYRSNKEWLQHIFFSDPHKNSEYQNDWDIYRGNDPKNLNRDTIVQGKLLVCGISTKT
jgi:hypothetical protein